MTDEKKLITAEDILAQIENDNNPEGNHDTTVVFLGPVGTRGAQKTDARLNPKE